MHHVGLPPVASLGGTAPGLPGWHPPGDDTTMKKILWLNLEKTTSEGGSCAETTTAKKGHHFVEDDDISLAVTT